MRGASWCLLLPGELMALAACCFPFHVLCFQGNTLPRGASGGARGRQPTAVAQQGHRRRRLRCDQATPGGARPSHHRQLGAGGGRRRRRRAAVPLAAGLRVHPRPPRRPVAVMVRHD